MKRILFLSLLGLTLFATGALIGCGDDKASDSKLAVGDTTDAEFLAARSAFEEAAFGEMTSFMLGFSFSLMDTVFEEGGMALSNRGTVSLAAQDSLLLTYHAGSQYWYLYMSVVEGTDTIVLKDSIQFLHATGPVQWPDTTLLTGINTGVNMRFGAGALSEVAVGQRLAIMGDIVQGGDVTIDGAQSFTFALESTSATDTCAISYDGSAALNDIALNLEEVFGLGGCPVSGQVTYVTDLHIDCTSGDSSLVLNGTWQVTQTFDNGMVTIVMEDGSTQWTYTEPCGGEVVMAPSQLDHWLNRQR